MATVAGLTGVSRVAGFTRDILTASILGAGPVADAFFVALKLPNFFRRVTAEGAFSVSFVPLYSAKLGKAEESGKSEDEAAEFSGDAFSVMFWLLSIFTVVIVAAMPWVIYAIAPGFHDDPVRYDLAVSLSRVTFPYLLMMSLTALMGGVLNAHERFAPFAAAPILFNLSLITFLLLSNVMFESAGHAMAYGVLVAGFLQFGLLALCVKRFGVKLKIPLRPRFDSDIKKLFCLMGPGVIGAGVVHINLFADVIMASLLEGGSISYLYYADRLNQLPLGIVGIAVGTALLPMLSKAFAAGDHDKSRHLFNRALEACFLLALPACTGLFVLAYPIVMALFQHGAFDVHAAQMTAMVVTAYAMGMPAYVAVKVFSTAYWAKHDTLTPVKVSMISTSFNIVLSLFLIFVVGTGVAGIAVATALAGWIQIALLAKGLKGRDDVRLDKRFKEVLPKIAGSCMVMGAFLTIAKLTLYPFFESGGHFQEIIIMLALVAGGMIVYGLAITATGVIKPNELKSYLIKG